MAVGLVEQRLAWGACLALKVDLVGRCGDQGVGLRARFGARRLVVQCKSGRRRATNAAVQQVFAGAADHGSPLAAVVAAGGFTPSAVTLATRIGFILMSPADLVDPASIHRVLGVCPHDGADRPVVVFDAERRRG